MASVWLHKKSVNWFARYKGNAGKTVNRSTGTSDRDEAERVATAWETEAARDRVKQIADVSAGGISDAVARAERLARQGRLDPSSARDLINDLLTAAGQSTLDAVTHRAWCDSWKAGKSGVVKARSKMKYDQVCRDWLKFLAGKADKPLEAVGKPEAVAFRDRLTKDGLAPRTTNQTVKLLRGIYSEAVEQGHIGRNPFIGLGALREDPDAAKREPFTAAEVGLLIAAAKDDWKGLIILAATTGLRLMDGARLKWSNLDLKAKVINIRTAKRGTRLVLPIHPTFFSWLKDQTRGIGAAPVFPTLATKGGPGKSGLSMRFKRLMEAATVSAGVAKEASKDSRGRTTSRKSFHSFRHFAATQLAANGVRAEIAHAITGHADSETHANYVTADIDAMRLAVDAIQLSA